MPRRRPVVTGEPITAEEIDKRFAELEEFAAESSSNIQIVERVRKLRGDVRLLNRLAGPPPVKPVTVDSTTRWG
jgi:hypothetical protein